MNRFSVARGSLGSAICVATVVWVTANHVLDMASNFAVTVPRLRKSFGGVRPARGRILMPQITAFSIAEASGFYLAENFNIRDQSPDDRMEK